MDNNRVKERFFHTIEKGTLSHAYIIEGENSAVLKNLAVEFAKGVLCEDGPKAPCGLCASCRKIDGDNHEDLVYVCREGTSIKDEAVEHLQNRLKKKPYVGDRTIAVIEDADTMTPRAQNRLLKTLEEPAGGAVLFLLSENTENLLMTIRSRCVTLRALQWGEGEELPEEALRAAKETGKMILADMPFYKVSRELSQVLSDRDQSLSYLDALEMWFRDRLVAPYDKDNMLVKAPKEENSKKDREKSITAIRFIEAARQDIRRGMGAGYAVKDMIIKMEDIEW